MANIYVKSGGGTIGIGDYRGIWVTASTWAVGDRVIAVNVSSYRVHECTTAGTGDAAEPTWDTTAGNTTTTGTAVFTTRLPSTWANATVSLGKAGGGSVAGDTVYVSHQHAETQASAMFFSFVGTQAAPIKVLCANDGAEPPTALATTATVTTTGTNAISFNNTTYAYFYGISFNAGTGAGSASLTMTGQGMRYEACNFSLLASGSSGRVSLSNFGGSWKTLLNCGFKFSNASQGITAGSGTTAYLDGCSLLSGGTSPSAFFVTVGNAYTVIIRGLDLTNASAGINISSSSTVCTVFDVINSRLPASWSGSLNSFSISDGSVWQMFNCDSADTNYRYRKATEYGTVQEETTLVRTGGASDGDTTISYKMVSNSSSEWPTFTLDSPKLFGKRITSTGSALTATVEILHDSATNLDDDEIWLECMYLGTSGTPLALFVDDAAADVLATPAAQADSSETWTTTGMANPNTQKLSVTFTPQEKGVAVFVVRLALASKTVYIDPLVTIA